MRFDCDAARRSTSSIAGARSRCRSRRRPGTPASPACGCPERRSAVRAARDALGGEVIDDAAPRPGGAACAIRRMPFFHDRRQRVCGGLSLPATAPLEALPAANLIEWGGALRWLRSDAPAERRSARCRGTARRHGDTVARRARCDRCFIRSSPASLELHRRLKQQVRSARHLQSRPTDRGAVAMETHLADWIRGTPDGDRGRIHSAHLRALWILQCDLPDLPVARRRTRRPARAHLPDQADARRRTRRARRRNCIWTAA